MCALCGPGIPASAQPQTQTRGAKLEALFTAAQMPFVKTEEGSYVAVITVDEGESDRFHVYQTAIGNDPNDEQLQVVHLYFLLGQLPKDAPVPIALIKQIVEWNAGLTMGKVVILDNTIVYTSSSWLSKTDADSLSLDALVGHYASKKLRKDIEPYLKQ
jgi:hypothetical protein